MFERMKQIDTAFRFTRLFSLVLSLASLTLAGFSVYHSYQWVQQQSQRIYILAQGKVLEGYASSRQDNIAVEARDDIRMFHEDFFDLDPDEEVIHDHIGRALGLADLSAERNYEDLKEQGYYDQIISGNISQRIHIDSIQLDLHRYPYYFRCYATEELIRSSSRLKRRLVTQGWLREVSRSDADPHGFLIQHWTILDNHDIGSSKP